jgi:hypothetical protein
VGGNFRFSQCQTNQAAASSQPSRPYPFSILAVFSPPPQMARHLYSSRSTLLTSCCRQVPTSMKPLRRQEEGYGYRDNRGTHECHARSNP